MGFPRPPRLLLVRRRRWGILVLSAWLLSLMLSPVFFTPLAAAMPDSAVLAIAQLPGPVQPGSGAALVELARQASYSDVGHEFGTFNLLIIFFVTLGPLKVIPTFVQLTRNASQPLRWQLAVRSSALSTLVILLVVIIGQRMLSIWHIQLPALMIAGGILLSLVSLKLLLAQYEAHPPTALSPDQPDLSLAITPLTFPTILPPFGIAIALTLMVIAVKVGYPPALVIGLLLLVMALNFISMVAARPIFKFIRPVTLRILGFTLSVLQFALGIQFILLALEIQMLTIKLLLDAN